MTSTELKTLFEERGYVAPVPIFDRRECRAILARLLRGGDRPPLDWGKGRAVTSRVYFELATDERIVDLVTELIGEDVLLWGAGLIARRPGQIHHWHTDIESASPTGKTVSVWIGLAETNPQSSLKVVPYSHEFGVTIQQLMQENGAGGVEATDADVAAWAKARDSRSGVAQAGTFDGDALLFDGRLWHGSNNLNERGTRYAVLLQYATPATPIRIPDLHPGWPVELQRAPKPACIAVSGHDAHAVNRVVPGPVPNGGRLPVLSSRIDTLQLPLVSHPDVDWQPRGLYRGATAAVERIGAHVSVLQPGRKPHPPHRHEQEELLMILDGESELVVENPRNPEQTLRHRLGRGSFAYYPAGFTHTMHNASAEPVTYVIFKWASGRGGVESIGQRMVSVSEAVAELRDDGPTGRSGKGLLKGETKHLRQLGAHVTTLRPGAGYEPHVDAYDVAIVVLEGTVETLGERVGRDSIIFYAAGEPHGMRNVGDDLAVYVVFELHGSPAKGALLGKGIRSGRMPARLAPRRLKKVLGRRARSVASRARRRLR